MSCSNATKLHKHQTNKQQKYSLCSWVGMLWFHRSRNFFDLLEKYESNWDGFGSSVSILVIASCIWVGEAYFILLVSVRYSGIVRTMPRIFFNLWVFNLEIYFVWKFDTLWDHPLDKGEATCHSSLCTNYAQRIRERLLQEFMTRWYCKKSWKIGREHSTCCGRNLVCDHPVSQY